MILSRRGLLSGLGAALAAPAIVKVASLMPIKALPLVFRTPYLTAESAWFLKTDDLSESALEDILIEIKRVTVPLHEMARQLEPGIRFWFGPGPNRSGNYLRIFEESL